MCVCVCVCVCVCGNDAGLEQRVHVGGSLYVFLSMCVSVSVCMSICDTYNATRPHSACGMWDFQVQNRFCCRRRKENWDNSQCVCSQQLRILIFIRIQRFVCPPFNKHGRSFCGVNGRCYGISLSLSLLTAVQ